VDWMNAPNPYSGLGGTSADIPGVFDLPLETGVPESSVLLGAGSDGLVSVDLKDESPHVLVNAPTGLGKSVLARSFAVQRLELGDLVVMLDKKMHSHRWARRLEPLVHYADTTPSIGAAWVNLGRELHRRNQVVRDWVGSPESAPVGPRVVVVFEETNATLTELAALDKTVPTGGYRALDAFRDVVFMGRAVGMHVIAFAQLASYRSGLSADILENFGTKVLIGASPKAWKWLVPECGAFRMTEEVKGRALVCRGSRVTETQLAWIPEEASSDRVLLALPAQRRARELVGGNRRRLSSDWREAIGR
jgi:hypothetical protein